MNKKNLESYWILTINSAVQGIGNTDLIQNEAADLNDLAGRVKMPLLCANFKEATKFGTKNLLQPFTIHETRDRSRIGIIGTINTVLGNIGEARNGGISYTSIKHKVYTVLIC